MELIYPKKGIHTYTSREVTSFYYEMPKNRGLR